MYVLDDVNCDVSLRLKEIRLSFFLTQSVVPGLAFYVSLWYDYLRPLSSESVDMDLDL